MEGASPSGETFRRYEEELDINDFPQTARWKVTSRVSRNFFSFDNLFNKKEI